MDLIEKAFSELYPGRNLDYNVNLVYSGRFKGYNANAAKSVTTLTVSMSKKWKRISKDIQIGIIQTLLVKFFGKKENTFNMDLYQNFIKHIHIAIPKNKIDPFLEESFDRVNKQYFYGMIEKPNLVWGQKSVRKLGSYDYQADEISMSTIFKESDTELLDYVMYHEMLHKKHKFYHTKSGKSYHHTTAFRDEERKFAGYESMEKELTRLCRKTRIRRVFFGRG